MAGQIPRPTNVETTNTGTVYHIQDDGSKVIAGSRRPDGTYRKPVRVRAGYTPLEENLYKGPEAQQRAQARSGHIPGMAPESEPKVKAKAKPKAAQAKAEVKPKAEAAPKAEAKAEPAPERAASDLSEEQQKKISRKDELQKEAGQIWFASTCTIFKWEYILVWSVNTWLQVEELEREIAQLSV
eukprot:Skav230141  [mRNA]  locus=scaffold1301:177911:186300:- [translate_table: standard]